MIGVSVDGIPKPQGSKRHVGGGRMIESSKGLKLWRKQVKAACVEAMNGEAPLDGDLAVDVVFYLPRPKTVKRLRPTVPPDLDKLVRGVCDAMSKVVYVDDARVTIINAEKIYTDDDPLAPVTPGASIEVWQVEP